MSRSLWLTVICSIPALSETLVQPVLRPGETVERRLTGNNVHRYPLAMAAGHFGRIQVQQIGADVRLRILEPGGKPYAEVDSLLPGFETLALLAETSGDYAIEVERTGGGESYRITLADFRPSEPRDRLGLDAQKAELTGMARLPNYQEAAPSFVKAFDLWRAAGDERGQLNAAAALVFCYRYLDRQRDQKRYGGIALALARKLGDAAAEAEELGELGWAVADLGEPAKGIELLEQSAAVFEKLNLPAKRAIALKMIGGVYENIAQTPRALEYYTRALSILRDGGDSASIASTLLSIGAGQLSMDRPREAVKPLEEALRIFRELKQRRNEAVTLRYLARVANELDDDPKSIALFKESIAVFRELRARTALASALNLQAQVHAERREWDLALPLLEESVELWRQGGGGQFLANALVWLGRVETYRGNLARAKAVSEEGLQIMEQIRTRTGGTEARLAFFSRYRPGYSALLDVLYQMKTGDAANEGFQLSERGRARALIEMLADAKVDPLAGVSPALLSQRETLGKNLAAALARQTALLSRSHTKAEAENLVREIEDLRHEQDRLNGRMRESSGAFSGLSEPAPYSIADVQRNLLDDDSVLIEYFLGGRRSYVWAITRKTAVMAELASVFRTEKLARACYDILTARNAKVEGETDEARRKRLEAADAAWAQQSAALSKMLLGPIADSLGARRWLVVADGFLHYIPFAALPLPEGVSGVPREIVNLPSASILGVIRKASQERKPAPRTLAVFADPVFDAKDPRVGGGASSKAGATRDAEETVRGELLLPRLPFTRREAEAVLAGLPKDSVKLAVDFAADRAAATSQSLASYRILHFATHGIINAESPELSGIVLSMVDAKGRPQDGFLRLHDIYNLKLPAELVVLSACQTALGKRVWGEGVIGLTRGMMYAGASRVVASLWKVDDAATAEFMRLFYAAMFQGKLAPSAALRQAQSRMAEQRRWRAPYYWAAFQLHGEYE